MSTKIPANITDQLELPVISAPMFLVSSANMVVEGCKSGIITTFPLLNARTTESLEEWMTEITEGLEKARNEEPNRKVAPWGVNIIIHHSNKRFEADLELLKKYQPPVVITSLGNPSLVVEVVHEYGGLVFSDVISTKHAKKAASCGVDGLILVCNGAGGHGGTINPVAFIAEVKQFWDGITILAGCLSNGRDVLAAQVLGADFAYMGTRFIATTEAMASEEYKEMLVDSDVDDILYTDAISGVNANFLTPSLRKAGLDLDNLQKPDKIDVAHVDTENEAKAWKDVWSAGQGVGAIKKVQPIAEVVRELKEEYDLAVQAITNYSPTSKV
ncbi:NAD(P)H-dependent flavin oxidoreductase [Alkalihalobacterium alkalinitrilicum]|uniref:NAD(P)H-dependent flavin oxidoreductase n=1 Tax=Alkalihalobacterium alkalinitrilicum TaxID=427920 RepID=UPI00099596AD|nr:nitronate monooxygenase [Alkalihalobacterium alkalinitrilicum]